MDLRHTGPVNGLSRPGPSMPPPQRGAMVARPWRGVFNSLGDTLRGRRDHVTTAPEASWEIAAQRRRRALLASTVLIALGATFVLSRAQPAYEHPLLQH